jgi:hypothetical protein
VLKIGTSVPQTDKVQAEDFESSLETPEMAMMCVDSPSLSSIWVDLAPMDPDLRIESGPEPHLALFLRYLKLGKHQRLLLVRWGGGGGGSRGVYGGASSSSRRGTVGGSPLLLRAFGDDWLCWA